LKLPCKIESVTVPSNTLLCREEGPCVGRISKWPDAVASGDLGRDFGIDVEVVSGVRNSDSVIVIRTARSCPGSESRRPKALRKPSNLEKGKKE
jgi:hypothetical protein